MKKLSFGLFLVSAGFTALFANAEGPLVTKSSGAGFTPPENGGGVQCDVYKDKVVITKVFGRSTPSSFVLTEERKISLSKDLTSVVELAKAEKIEEKPNSLCDAPASSIVAGTDLVLYSTGGCGTPAKKRQGPASSKLVQLVNVFCPNTF